MIEASLDLSRGEEPVFLFVGAHADDIEIGCGATALHLAERYPDAEFYWLVMSAHGVRAAEATSSASRFLAKAANRTIRLEQYRDGFFPQEWESIKELFEGLKEEVSPSVVFSHYRNDLHQDHRVINELTWNTFRSHMILEYEIPKYDGDLGSPSVFTPMSDENRTEKCRILRDEYSSQSDKQWFSDSTFEAIARLRGIECNAPSGYAEAFYCRKMSFRL
jgi:LmbE family N-acetylglucosaminyl deacetylase